MLSSHSADQQQHMHNHQPKSRSKLHHHNHHHHHQHPSWSSSLSAFSLQQQHNNNNHNNHNNQRASAFLIDEYGNEHDPEHCPFKTLATNHSRSSTSTSSSSLRSPSISTTHSRPSSPSSSTQPSLSSHILTPNHSHPSPKNPSPPRASWTKTLWAHLRPSPTALAQPSSPPSLIYDNHHATHPIFSIPVVPKQPPSPSPRRLKTLIRPAASIHPSAIRSRLELVKLEVRFGILRTRKRVLGVWKQKTAAKKP